MADGRFPSPVNIGGNAVRWLRSECEQALKRMADPEMRAAVARAKAERFRKAVQKRRSRKSLMQERAND